MSKFVPNKDHSRRGLNFGINLKKTAAESYRMLREAYGDHALSQDKYERWFWRFKSCYFGHTDNGRGKPPKKYEDSDRQAFLDENNGQTTRIAIRR